MSPALGSGEQVGSQTGQDAAAEFGIPFVEVSAKTGANVREAFMFVTTRAVGEHLARDRLNQSTGRARRRSVKTTIQRVPDLQVCYTTVGRAFVCLRFALYICLTVCTCMWERGAGRNGRTDESAKETTGRHKDPSFTNLSPPCEQYVSKNAARRQKSEYTVEFVSRRSPSPWRSLLCGHMLLSISGVSPLS